MSKWRLFLWIFLKLKGVGNPEREPFEHKTYIHFNYYTGGVKWRPRGAHVKSEHAHVAGDAPV